jgi:spore maturation protein CgeB
LKKYFQTYDFNNFKQLKDLIDYYLTNPEEAEKIRKAGFDHVRKNHTYKNRWKHILKEVLK